MFSVRRSTVCHWLVCVSVVHQEGLCFGTPGWFVCLVHQEVSAWRYHWHHFTWFSFIFPQISCSVCDVYSVFIELSLLSCAVFYKLLCIWWICRTLKCAKLICVDRLMCVFSCVLVTSVKVSSLRLNQIWIGWNRNLVDVDGITLTHQMHVAELLRLICAIAMSLVCLKNWLLTLVTVQSGQWIADHVQCFSSHSNGIYWHESVLCIQRSS